MNAGDVIFKFKMDDKDINVSLKNIGKKFETIGKSLTTFVSLPIAALATFGVKYNMQMEQYQTSLEILLGSAEDAANMLTTLKNMAARTPFETADLISASQTLLAYGYNADKIIPTLEMLGDVSLGDKNKLSTLTLAFGQVASKGHLAGQELLQMVNAGFNPLQIISEKTGESMNSLTEKMSKGAISVDMVSEAFKIATTEGGRFYGGMDKQSKTATGKLSTMMDSLKESVGSLTQSLLPIITRIIEKITELANKFNGLSEEQKKNILKFLGIAAAIGPLLIGIGKLIGLINGVQKAFTLLSSNPTILLISAIVLAIAALIAIMIQLWQESEEFRNAIKNIFSALQKDFKPFIDNLKNIFGAIKDVIKGVVLIIGGILGGDLKMIINGVKSLFKGLLNFIISIINALINVVNKGINFVISPFKLLIKALNKIPGVNIPIINFAIPNIPKLATGTNEIITEGLYHLHEGEMVVPKKFNPTLSPNMIGNMKNTYNPNIKVIVNNNFKQDPLGQMVNNIKTYSGGAKNSYNYGGALS